MTDPIKENYTESIQTKIAAAEALPDAIHTAAQMLTICLLNGHKVMVYAKMSPSEIPWGEIAFPSVHWTLNYWRESAGKPLGQPFVNPPGEPADNSPPINGWAIRGCPYGTNLAA